VKNKSLFIIIGLIILTLADIGIYNSSHDEPEIQAGQTNSKIIQVVAAENFYGDIVKQLGGNHVQVLSILSDPNIDPHEYESDVKDAVAVSKANLIIKNGMEYDNWIDKLLKASPNNNRIVLKAEDITDHRLPDNPHLWYNIDNVQEIAGKITSVLKQQDPADANEFDQNLTKFDRSLSQIRQTIRDINTNFANTPIAHSETVYLFQIQATGLHDLTPFAYEKAINEDNDPSASDVATANDQVSQKKVKVLIYDIQNATPVTQHLLDAAKQQNIPIVSVSETMPPDKHYQSWIEDQLTALEQALQSTK